MTSKISWCEVSPGEWGNYITLQEKAEPVFLSACAMKLNQLQNENAPLLAMLNGKLQSVSEDIYDSFKMCIRDRIYVCAIVDYLNAK